MKLKTHCKNGHEFTEETTRVRSDVRNGKDYSRRVCKACESLHGQANREENKEYMRNHNLKNSGWTSEQVDATIEEQERKCAICKILLNLDNKMDKAGACADHEHTKPPKPRGILCRSCNMAIGLLQDSPEVLRAAADYIERFR